MDPVEDDDVKLIRASTSLLTDLKSLLGRTLWKKPKDNKLPEVHRSFRRRDLDGAIAKVRGILVSLHSVAHSLHLDRTFPK